MYETRKWMKDGGQQGAAAVMRQPWGASLRLRHLHKHMKVVEMGALKLSKGRPRRP